MVVVVVTQDPSSTCVDVLAEEQVEEAQEQQEQ